MSGKEMKFPFLIFGTCSGKILHSNFVLEVYSGSYSSSVIANNLTMDELKKCRPHAGAKVACVITGTTKLQGEYDFNHYPYLVGHAVLLPDDFKFTARSSNEEIDHHTALASVDLLLDLFDKGDLDGERLWYWIKSVSMNGLPHEVNTLVRSYISDGRADLSESDADAIRQAWRDARMR